MILSKATGYGIRALVYLARHPKNRLCGLEEIARKEQIPPAFLRKVLGELRRHRFLRSAKGIHGGYALARSAESITLWEVIVSLGNRAEFDLCVLGCGYCSPEEPCPLHEEWKPLRQRLVYSWQAKTISEIAAVSETRRRAAGGDSAGSRGDTVARDRCEDLDEASF